MTRPAGARKRRSGAPYGVPPASSAGARRPSVLLRRTAQPEAPGRRNAAVRWFHYSISAWQRKRLPENWKKSAKSRKGGARIHPRQGRVCLPCLFPGFLIGKNPEQFQKFQRTQAKRTFVYSAGAGHFAPVCRPAPRQWDQGILSSKNSFAAGYSATYQTSCKSPCPMNPLGFHRTGGYFFNVLGRSFTAWAPSRLADPSARGTSGYSSRAGCGESSPP